MATTIQTIEKPTKARALDTSGSNNHGQIYSGRALEFDGVSDHLTFNPAAKELNNITVACWINSTLSDNWDTILGHNDGFGDYIWFHVKDSDRSIAAQLNKDDGSGSTITYGTLKATNVIEANTWYRAVLTYDSSSGAKIYLNGVEVESEDTTGPLDNDSGALYIGCSNSAINYEFGGMMSDWQMWNATWTAADALYDYNNPEQLALNNPGTSLKNSNLTTWFPMNDGHRGQQSFILDASNTGLGDSILTNGDFSNGTTGWTAVDVTASVGTHYGFSNVCEIVSDGDSTAYLWQPDIFTNHAGVTLKLSVDYYLPSTNTTIDSFDIRINTAQAYTVSDNNAVTDTWTTVFCYATIPDTTYDAMIIYLQAAGTHTGMTSGDKLYIKNVKAEPVNDKNHATTVFTGDELITSDYADNGTFTNDNGNWATFGSDVAISTWSGTSGNGADNGGLIVNPGSTSTEAQGVQLGTSYFETLVVGKTYRVTVDIDGSSGGLADFQIGLGGATSANFTITTSWATYTKDLVATSDAALTIANINADEDSDWKIDNVSIKEVGVATGWTDADQQLDIPQTALQSYNQLAWFPGVDPGVDISAKISDHASIDDIWTNGGTCSAWVYIASDGAGTMGRIFDKAKWSLYTYSESGSTCHLAYSVEHATTNGTGKTTNRVITYGNWYHILMTYNSNSGATAPLIYINGESIAVTEDTESEGSVTTDNGQHLYLGNRSNGQRTFDGTITEVSLWDEILTQAEVNELYNDGKAFDAFTHSNRTALICYVRNNGLATWSDLSSNSNNAVPTNLTETMLITAGVDGSRDSQGFLMNRQKLINSLNTNEESYTTVDINHTFGTADFSYGFWFKLEDTENGYLVGVQTIGQSGGVGLLIDAGNGKIRARPFGATAVYTSAGYDDGEWHYAHHNIDRSANAILYIDKTAVLTQDISDRTGNSLSTNNWHIGAEVGTNGFLAGEIDDLVVYSDILTTAEITRNYNAGKRSHR